MQGTIQKVNLGNNGEYDLSKQLKFDYRRAKQFWIACHNLIDTIKHGNKAGTDMDKRRLPLEDTLKLLKEVTFYFKEVEFRKMWRRWVFFKITIDRLIWLYFIKMKFQIFKIKNFKTKFRWILKTISWTQWLLPSPSPPKSRASIRSRTWRIGLRRFVLCFFPNYLIFSKFSQLI